MTEWISGDVNVNGIKIHYQRTGGDKPALVFSHGTTDSGLTWVPFADELEEYLDVITYDRRGHGQSDAPESGYTFNQYALDLSGLLKALDLESVVLVGHSGGAATAAIVAAEHPEWVSGLVLEDPPWGTGWGGWKIMSENLVQIFKEILSLKHDKLDEETRKKHPGWSEEAIAAWVEGKLHMSPNLIQHFQQPEPDWRKTADKITCPVMLITSDLNRDPLNTEDDVRDIMVHFKNARKVRIKGTGHVIHNDNPQEFLRTVQVFLWDILRWRRRR